MGRRSFLAGATAVPVVLALGAAAPAPEGEVARTGIQATLDASAAAWSAGDLDRFMHCYERSAATTYVSGARFVQGYDAIRAMYAARFGGGAKASMGRLTLETLDFRLLAPDLACVVGRFHLQRDAAMGGDAGGLTTLLLRHTADGWRIIADHS